MSPQQCWSVVPMILMVCGSRASTKWDLSGSTSGIISHGVLESQAYRTGVEAQGHDDAEAPNGPAHQAQRTASVVQARAPASEMKVDGMLPKDLTAVCGVSSAFSTFLRSGVYGTSCDRFELWCALFLSLLEVHRLQNSSTAPSSSNL
eukprot:4074983-Amphidinium_carterae.1